MNTLRITEIFFSLQGEAASVGWPTVFIRLTGCPLRCQYCDTSYAFSGGQSLTVAEILKQVAGYKAKHITVTGGEPLAQLACLELLSALCDKNYNVSLETSGAMDIKSVDQRVVRVMDIKTPGSKEERRNLWQNIQHLNSNDQIKFVLCDRNDYQWAKEIIVEHNLSEICQVLFSASQQQLEDRTLADWILEDSLPVRFQIQLHKYLWGDAQGR